MFDLFGSCLKKKTRKIIQKAKKKEDKKPIVPGKCTKLDKMETAKDRAA